MADASALTALRYRATFNRSVLTNGFTESDALDLLYAAVNDELSYEEFTGYKNNRKYAADIYVSAAVVLKEIMKDSGVKHNIIKKVDEDIQEIDNSAIYDEFCIVAVMTNIGLSFDLLREVSIIQLIYIIAQTYEMKYGKKEDEFMTDDEILEAWGIDVSDLEDIEV